MSTWSPLVERLERDRERLLDAHARRVNVLPLGTAALAGASLPIDRDSVRRTSSVSAALCRNSLDASADRDFVAETIFALSPSRRSISQRLGRGGGSSGGFREFGFLQLPDAVLSHRLARSCPRRESRRSSS